MIILKLFIFSLFLEIFKDTSINYSTAGVIAHLQSEWPNKWPLSKPKVEEINLAVITSITNWSVNAESFITYQY